MPSFHFRTFKKMCLVGSHSALSTFDFSMIETCGFKFGKREPCAIPGHARTSFSWGVRIAQNDLHLNASDLSRKWSAGVEEATFPPAPPASALGLLGALCGWCKQRSSWLCSMPVGRGGSVAGPPTAQGQLLLTSSLPATGHFGVHTLTIFY